jgi:hypothetical protein
LEVNRTVRWGGMWEVMVMVGVENNIRSWNR